MLFVTDTVEILKYKPWPLFDFKEGAVPLCETGLYQRQALYPNLHLKRIVIHTLVHSECPTGLHTLYTL